MWTSNCNRNIYEVHTACSASLYCAGSYITKPSYTKGETTLVLIVWEYHATDTQMQTSYRRFGMLILYWKLACFKFRNCHDNAADIVWLCWSKCDHEHHLYARILKYPMALGSSVATFKVLYGYNNMGVLASKVWFLTHPHMAHISFLLQAQQNYQSCVGLTYLVNTSHIKKTRL